MTGCQFLSLFGVTLHGHVIQIGTACLSEPAQAYSESWWQNAEDSLVRCGDPKTSQAMVRAIDEAKESKDSLGGVFEVIAEGLPPGLGSYQQWDLRLDGRLAQAVMSIPGIKGIEFGLGFEQAARRGTQVHDPLYRVSDAPAQNVAVTATPFVRGSNHAGGLEGGMTNGSPLVVRAVMKPIATLMNPLDSVDVKDGQAAKAHVERADTCVVPAASRIAESMVSWVCAQALLELCGAPSLSVMQRNFKNYLEAFPFSVDSC